MLKNIYYFKVSELVTNAVVDIKLGPTSKERYVDERVITSLA